MIFTYHFFFYFLKFYFDFISFFTSYFFQCFYFFTIVNIFWTRWLIKSFTLLKILSLHSFTYQLSALKLQSSLKNHVKIGIFTFLGFLFPAFIKFELEKDVAKLSGWASAAAYQAAWGRFLMPRDVAICLRGIDSMSTKRAQASCLSFVS